MENRISIEEVFSFVKLAIKEGQVEEEAAEGDQVAKVVVEEG